VVRVSEHARFLSALFGGFMYKEGERLSSNAFIEVLQNLSGLICKQIHNAHKKPNSPKDSPKGLEYKRQI
jgi:hypothetical protein